MQVQKINNSVYQNNTVPAPNFKAKGFSPEMIEALNKDSTRFARFLTYAGDHQGEALNVLVTAFGTAIVCPMFIRFNPFSKEDKETRAYSAWRQPISALIAVVVQLTITKWFNNHLALKASTPNKEGKANYARADLRDFPDKGYLTRIVKLEHPDWDKKAVAREVERRQIDTEKKAIAKARKEMKNDSFAVDMVISQNPEKDAKKLLLKELQTEFKEEVKTKFGESATPENNKELKRYLEGKLKEKAAEAGKTEAELIKDKSEHMVKGLLCQDNIEGARKDVYEKLKVDHKAEIEQKFNKPIEQIRNAKLNKYLEKKLKEIAASEGLEEIDYLGKVASKKMEQEILGEAIIKGYIRKLIDKDNGIKNKKQAFEFSEENSKKFMDGLIEYIKKDLKDVAGLEEKLFGAGVGEKAKNAKIKEYAKNIIEKLNCSIEYAAEHDSPLNMTLPKLGDTIEEIIQSVKIKKYMKGKHSDAMRVFKTQGTQKGLIMTLITLPFTCGVLNWAYPRIMERIMPEMVARKKQAQAPVQKEGGDE